MSIILTEAHYARQDSRRTIIRESIREDPKFKGELETLDIRVSGACEVFPHLHMNESCKYLIHLRHVAINFTIVAIMCSFIHAHNKCTAC